MDIRVIKKNKTFDGETVYYEHDSLSTKTTMRFSVFLPASKTIDSAIIWLSGLTCNEENFITKAGSQRCLKDSSTMIICPDTSPRGLNLKDEHDSYDFGSGAGFYLNATTQGYKDHYQMYDYICKDIVAILKNNFNALKISIMGHSMGGHGALVLGIREKELFKSVSAFSPMVNPLMSSWGMKAFKGYLGEELLGANSYDATELLLAGNKREDTILIDQGLNDEFLSEHLLTENLVEAAKSVGQEVSIKYREGYDHSYFYISSFIKEHIDFHLESLNR
ncbi:S-formylglutathione hydrolase [Halobacteriovorax sp. HLS]|uniref:S-formylglutathione hydrolase n=1 Tax=Halobacteriovorax sp. HLS TaxID=2234000 RepID=UPI000FD81883|nr:S-formylglutathione hydrolase [Halobacteriovorax sp. HLS]